MILIFTVMFVVLFGVIGWFGIWLMQMARKLDRAEAEVRHLTMAEREARSDVRLWRNEFVRLERELKKDQGPTPEELAKVLRSLGVRTENP